MTKYLLAFAIFGYSNASDILYLESGNEIEGRVIGADKLKTRILENKGDTTVVPSPQIVAIRLNGLLINQPINFDSVGAQLAELDTISNQEIAKDKDSSIRTNMTEKISQSASLFQSGSMQVVLGHFLIVTGLLTQAIGATSLNSAAAPALIPYGFLSWHVGLPLLGFGSDRIGAAVHSKLSDYHDGSDGWGAYYTSLIFEGIGAAFIIAPVIVSPSDEPPEDYAIYLFFGAGSLFISNICGFRAWYEFAHRSNLSSRAYSKKKETGKTGFYVFPDIAIDQAGGMSPKLAMIVSF